MAGQLKSPLLRLYVCFVFSFPTYRSIRYKGLYNKVLNKESPCLQIVNVAKLWPNFTIFARRLNFNVLAVKCSPSNLIGMQIPQFYFACEIIFFRPNCRTRHCLICLPNFTSLYCVTRHLIGRRAEN